MGSATDLGSFVDSVSSVSSAEFVSSVCSVVSSVFTLSVPELTELASAELVEPVEPEPRVGDAAVLVSAPELAGSEVPFCSDASDEKSESASFSVAVCVRSVAARSEVWCVAVAEGFENGSSTSVCVGVRGEVRGEVREGVGEGVWEEEEDDVKEVSRVGLVVTPVSARVSERGDSTPACAAFAFAEGGGVEGGGVAVRARFA